MHMKFRTELNIPKSPTPIEHSEKILTIGSCFAENIAGYFRELKFNVTANPFGVLYNPVSILNSFRILKEGRKFNDDDLVYEQGEWHSFYHHSDFSYHDKNLCLSTINTKIAEVSGKLKSIDRVIITYGTSFVYEHKEKEIIVSNCHKIPAKEFSKYKLELDEVIENAEESVKLLTEINPNIQILFTVSPVRHWQDGAVDNQISKSCLILAVAEVVKKNENCEYFPSYEIMMDDLRDYRFYESDLLHPNRMATDYIWELFSSSKLSESCNLLMAEISKITKAAKHRIRNPHSDTTRKFAELNLDVIERLQLSNKHLNLDSEKKYFQNLL